MNTKLFGQFLLEKGYVSREQLLEALQEQRRSTGTLGELAIATGMLTLADVDAIHRLQTEESQPFSAAAVQLGLLTEKQLAELLHPNSAEKLLLGQILVAFGHLDEATLQEALTAHAGVPRVDEGSLMKHFRGSDLSEVGPACISVMSSVFRQTIGAPVSYNAIPAVKAISVGQPIWTQEITRGDERFLVAVQLDQADTFVIAEAVLKMPVDGFPELATDAVSEFLNIVSGHICANVTSDSGTVTAAPPVICTPDEFARKGEPGIAVHCTSDQVEFTYVVARALEAAKPVGHWAVSAQEPVVRGRVRQPA